jgi:hypothetical protein
MQICNGLPGGYRSAAQVGMGEADTVDQSLRGAMCHANGEHVLLLI